METIESVLSNPIFASFVGWLAFNVIMLSMFKDDNEKTFNIKAYATEHWDNWAASFVMIPVLLFIGYKGLSIPVDGKLEWNDIYFLAAGFATEAVKMIWKKFKKKTDTQ